MSAALSAGTTAPVAGSSYIVIVPPVKSKPIIAVRGASRAVRGAPCCSLQHVQVLQSAASVEDDDGLVWLDEAVAHEHAQGVQRRATFRGRADAFVAAKVTHPGHHVGV